MALLALLSTVAVIVLSPAVLCDPAPASDRGRRNLTAACPDFPWPNLRLPTDLTPVSYDLRIQPNLSSLVFNGTVRISLAVRRQTDLIVVHSKDLRITHRQLSVGKKSSPTAPDISSWHECDSPLEQLALRLSAPLEKGARVSLDLHFEGNITSSLVGLYRSVYVAADGAKEVAAVTQFEATDARRMFPCLDEPAMKAEFRVAVVRDERHVSLANMNLVRTQPLGDLFVDAFNTSVRMSTYLVAIAVGDFAHIANRTRDGTEVSIYAPSDEIADGQCALDVATRALEYLETFFHIAYPLPKQDFLAVADFNAGAMENWGLITFRDSLLLFNELKSATISLERIATVIVHELAHQWFGNLVTMEWWNDLWLNEGFASFMEYFATARLFPDWHLMESFYVENVATGLYLDGLISSHPISVTVEDPAEIGSIFDAISYQKGASLINMFMALAGEERFRAGLEDYLNKHKYGNAAGEDLWTVLQQHMDKLTEVKLTDAANTWTDQVGYPLVHVALLDRRRLVVERQSRFVYLQSEQVDAPQVWPIPITYESVGHSNESGRVWMQTNASVTVNLDEESDFVLVNLDGNGFYRVQYDAAMYDALAAMLRSDAESLSGATRAALLNDAFSLLKAGALPVARVFGLAEYARVHGETERAPWRILASHLGGIESLLLESPLLEPFEDYARSFVRQPYEKVDWQLTDDHRARLQSLSTLALACHLHVGDCVAKARGLYARWKNASDSVAADLKALAVATGVKYGDGDDFDLVFERYVATRLPSERNVYLTALGASRRPALLSRLLQYTLDRHAIKPNLMPSVFSAVASNPVGRLIAWRFLRKHWNEITQLLGPTTLIGSVIDTTIRDFSSDFDYDEAVAFFRDKELGKSASRVTQTLEGIRINIQWRKLNEEPLKSWLDERKV